MVDAREVGPRLEQPRVALHPRLERRSVVGDEQVDQLVEQDVVDDVGRHRHQAVGEPDRAVGGRARAPATPLVGDPAHRRRDRPALEVPTAQLGGPRVELRVGASGAALARDQSADELLDVGHDLGPRHPLRHDDDRAAVLAVGGHAAPASGAAAHLDAVRQPGDVDDGLAHREQPNPGHRRARTSRSRGV